ncbi:MAG: diguanylate cyclase [Deltaproteobacteria bacterium]|nr:diguanylate cyclase [Deltaproteobacteria bacterium]
MLDNQTELATYKEIYEQLVTLKHTVYSCTDISSDLESLAILFSQKIALIQGNTPNAVWLIEGTTRAVEIALNGNGVSVGRRRELPLEHEVLRCVFEEQTVMWPANLNSVREVFVLFQSPVLFPIKSGRTVLGFLVIDLVRPNEADLLQSIAHFAGLIFAAGRLYHEAEEQRKELEEQKTLLSSTAELLLTQHGLMVSLHNAALDFANANDPTQVLHLVTELLVTEFGAGRAAAFLLSQDSQEMIGVSEKGGLEGIEGLKLPWKKEARIGQAIKTKRIFGYMDHPGALVLGPNELTNWIIFPAKGREDVLGVVIAEIKTEDNLDPMAILVHNASMMLETLLMLEMQKRLSILDSLTGLHNHRYFVERFQVEFSRAKRYLTHLTLIMADLDYFKQVNDAHGHAVGDQVLREVAGRMKDKLRDSDIIARYGGEEFVALLPETDIESGRTVAEKLRRAICEALIESDAGSLHISISIGVTSYPGEGVESRDVMFKKADQALYLAKESGRNRVIALPALAPPTPGNEPNQEADPLTARRILP